MKCAAITKKGKPCPWRAQYDTLCLSHAAANGDEAAKAQINARAKRGGDKSKGLSEQAKLTHVSLRSTGDHLTQLEATYLEVARSGGDVAARAKVKVEIIKCASALLKTEVIETELQGLKELVAQHMPHLRKHLAVVK